MASSVLSLASATPSVSLSFHGLHKGRSNLGGINKEKTNTFIKAKSFGRTSMVVTSNVSRFEGITMAPPDPILGVSEAFKADNHELKLNLGVGAYRTEELQPYVLDVVKKADKLLLEKGENREYLPIEGLAAFNKVTAELLFGADNPVIKQQRVATVQGLSGTGSLRLAAALIERYFPGAKVLISSLLGAAPEGSFVLLHGCAHNPTGIDPTPEQWEIIADVIQEKNHVPFFDIAYQGFASGSLDADAASVRMFVVRGMEVIAAQSYSKKSWPLRRKDWSN
ncbi:Aspartate aminotransferase [Hibiscus syriacus]|uniref:Aspartate aminotransferase n=1 Tax=Hibiscus syriacus TaxID=106335 RepID=A0A6A2XVR4_HIBSY|nr:Aspartate aminotransferase [Hibiscus syriacus]